MSKSMKPINIMLSVFALLNVMLVPIFNVWGGLIPEDVDENFLDVLNLFFEGTDNWRLWIVQLTMAIFIPSFFMFVMALVGNRPLFILADLIGILLWCVLIYDYINQNEGVEELIDFEDGSISIGTWIAIIIFVVSFFAGLASRKRKELSPNKPVANVGHVSNGIQISNTYMPNDRGDYGDSNLYGSSGNLNTQENIKRKPVSSQEDSDVFKYCPHCGAEINDNVRFCGKCGKKI